ncbi:hypothetical protein [Nocardia aurea]|uniref:FXSXX-COOH protein n=1 Tax=Nocardia aurea TaxID=2144174 RepID=A0ABV3FXI1_9NOCA
MSAFASLSLSPPMVLVVEVIPGKTRPVTAGATTDITAIPEPVVKVSAGDFTVSKPVDAELQSLRPREVLAQTLAEVVEAPPPHRFAVAVSQ